ncbi:MAG: Gfo/Idh/MocA family oxidoreductase [Saprospiraceae bacterium]|nr:Gfo/Idh/MocA family oxidoreductase [Saprospiraceae bacterium]
MSLNWGIIGLGKIARKFASDLEKVEGAQLLAVASRSEERAAAFAGEFDASFSYGNYQEILGCPDLDLVYVATPHTSHHRNTIMCLEAGIPVLCEKPFAMNSGQLREMVQLARSRELFLMEAIWTRFLPHIGRMLDLIEAGTLGRVVGIKADFGFNPPFQPESRLYNLQLGGGCLLDIGIYPVFLALLVLGRPDRIDAMASMGSTGVDEECGVLFSYDGGQMAHLHATFRARTKTEGFIYCEEGVIHLHSRWHSPSSLSYWKYSDRPEFVSFEYDNHGYAYEAAEVGQCMKKGLLESPKLPLDFSLMLMETLDAIRKEAGIHYPDWD